MALAQALIFNKTTDLFYIHSFYLCVTQLQVLSELALPDFVGAACATDTQNSIEFPLYARENSVDKGTHNRHQRRGLENGIPAARGILN